MLATLLVGLAVLLTLFQLWWAAAYTYAYRQLRAVALLVQVVQGLAYVLFFSLSLSALRSSGGLSDSSARALLGLLLVIVLTTALWHWQGGPTLLARYYPRRWRDVLAFRRPAVDLKRRVRGR